MEDSDDMIHKDLSEYLDMSGGISTFWAFKYSYNGIFFDLFRKIIFFNFTQKRLYKDLAKKLDI